MNWLAVPGQTIGAGFMITEQLRKLPPIFYRNEFAKKRPLIHNQRLLQSQNSPIEWPLRAESTLTTHFTRPLSGWLGALHPNMIRERILKLAMLSANVNQADVAPQHDPREHLLDLSREV